MNWRISFHERLRKAVKTLYDENFPTLEKEQNEAFQEKMFYQKMINNHEHIFTMTEYNDLLLCTHEANPSRRDTQARLHGLKRQKISANRQALTPCISSRYALDKVLERTTQMDAQNEAYIIARDNFWREQIRNPPYNWAGWSKVFWGTFAVALLIVLALAGAPWIFLFFSQLYSSWLQRGKFWFGSLV